MVILLLCRSTGVNGTDAETGILEIRVVDAALDRPCPARLQICDCLGWTIFLRIVSPYRLPRTSGSSVPTAYVRRSSPGKRPFALNGARSIGR